MNDHNPYAEQQVMADEVGTVTVSPTTGKLAIGSLVCGLVFCCPVTSLLAPVLGIAHFVSAAGKPWVRGSGLAIGGILLGLVFSAGWAFFVWSGYSVFRQAIEMPQVVLADLEAGEFEAVKSRLIDGGVATEELVASWNAVRERFGTFESIEFDENAPEPDAMSNAIDLPFLATFRQGETSRTVPVRFRFLPVPGTLEIRILEIEFSDEDGEPLWIPDGGSEVESPFESSLPDQSQSEPEGA